MDHHSHRPLQGYERQVRSLRAFTAQPTIGVPGHPRRIADGPRVRPIRIEVDIINRSLLLSSSNQVAPMQLVPRPRPRIPWRADVQPKTRLARLLLENEEPALVALAQLSAIAARLLLSQRKAKEGDVRLERTAENRLPLLVAQAALVVRRPDGPRGVDDQVGVALNHVAAHEQ